MLEVKLKVCLRVNYEGFKDISEKIGKIEQMLFLVNFDLDDVVLSCFILLDVYFSLKRVIFL